MNDYRFYGEEATFDYDGFLGERSYYFEKKVGGECWKNIGEAIRSTQKASLKIDAAGLLGVVMKNYPLGERTMVEGVRRTPWGMQPDGNGGWLIGSMPQHDNKKLPPEDIAKKLYLKLYDEALLFLSGKKTVGILLSGGMDSRIIAGILKDIQLRGDFSGDIVALTWGKEESRDVQYSKKIASDFQWEFMHFPLNADVLAENILLAGELGAEFSPLHLHAMKDIANVKGVDGIIAGSYGDSIGRGEYSGKHLKELPDILSKNLNHFSLILKNVERQAFVNVQDDVAALRNRFFRKKEYAYREIEMQLHYMRRQLNSCMNIIDDKVPLYQMFSHPNVYGFMWSFDPACRTDDVYENLLKILPGGLLDIPWARDGKIYNDNSSSIQDAYTSSNNKYGSWLRNECYDLVVKKISDGSLQSLGVFNERSLNRWIKDWGWGGIKANRMDEKMAWLASLSIFVRKYDIKGVDEIGNYSIHDLISEGRSVVHTWLYRKANHFIKK